MSQISAKASLRVMGVGLDLEAISIELGLKPTYVHLEQPNDGSKRTRIGDIWLLDSPLDKRKPLDVHLRWLVTKLMSHREYLKSLGSSAKIDVFLSYTMEGDQGGFSLSSKSLAFFSGLNIGFEFSLISLQKVGKKVGTGPA